MTRQLIVEIYWPRAPMRPERRKTYLVLAETRKRAVARVEARWAGKQGGADPHTTEVINETDTDLFEIVRQSSGMVY